MTQYGFFFDQSRCVDCKACAIACKDWNDIPPGPAKWLRIFQWEKGVFPDLELHHLFAPCYHCENPVCIDACPYEALYKEDKYGAVLVDEEKCQGARQCWLACPYGAIVYASDAPGEKAQKCTMCIDRLEQGDMPVCVMACPTRALDFGPLSDLQEEYGTLRQLEDMPEPTEMPAVVFKPRHEKHELLAYPRSKAIALLQYRWPLPPVFESEDDILPVDGGKTALVMKPRDEEELLYYTSDDES
jgi:anaerobic dimethyl sulfoxide reductase subunit B (iron-sulfur subunit)